MSDAFTRDDEQPDAQVICARCDRREEQHYGTQRICPTVAVFKPKRDIDTLPLVKEHVDRLRERLRLAHARINDLESVDLEEGALRLALTNWYQLRQAWPDPNKNPVQEEKELTAAEDALIRTIEAIGLGKRQ